MTTITRRYRFSASHRLHSDQLSSQENQRVYGKCNNPFGHGHDYILNVSVAGQTDADGLIVNLQQMDRLVAEEVLAPFSHRNLNEDVSEFKQLVPTTENLTLVIAARLKARWPEYFSYSSAHLHSISMFETERNSFEVLLPAAPGHSNQAAIDSKESVIVNA